MIRRASALLYAGAAALLFAAAGAYLALAPGTAYDSPAALARSHETAFALVPNSAGNLKELMERYFVCESFRQGSPMPCKNIDPWAMKLDASGRLHPPCELLYREALALKSEMTPGDSMDNCLAWERQFYADPQGGDEPGWEYKDCLLLKKAVREADVAGYCAWEGSADDMAGCPLAKAHLAGDPDRCAAIQGDDAAKNRCRAKALLLKALKEKNPELTAKTMFAPLVDKSASCDHLGDELMALYEDSLLEQRALEAQKR